MMTAFVRCFIALSLFFPAVAAAESYQVLKGRDTFVEAVSGAKLTRMGIQLDVTPDGQILGKAFGQPVRGQWTWANGFFCRDLAWGDRDLGYNCQRVELNGATMRFTSDYGSGPSAELKLR